MKKKQQMPTKQEIQQALSMQKVKKDKLDETTLEKTQELTSLFDKVAKNMKDTESVASINTLIGEEEGKGNALRIAVAAVKDLKTATALNPIIKKLNAETQTVFTKAVKVILMQPNVAPTAPTVTPQPPTVTTQPQKIIVSAGLNTPPLYVEQPESTPPPSPKEADKALSQAVAERAPTPESRNSISSSDSDMSLGSRSSSISQLPQPESSVIILPIEPPNPVPSAKAAAAAQTALIAAARPQSAALPPPLSAVRSTTQFGRQ